MDVNPAALFTMLGLVLGWLALVLAALATGRFATVAFLILTLIALFLYVPWTRLRADGIDRSSRPTRFWTNIAMAAVCLAACLAFGMMLARRTGLL